MARIYNIPIDEGELQWCQVITVEQWTSGVDYLHLAGWGYWVKDGLRSADDSTLSPPQDATHVAVYAY